MNERYQTYLQSEHWEMLRRQALSRAGGKCEYCGAPHNAVHHVRYPKHLKDDGLDNLVVVCARCHDLSHGIRPNDKAGIETSADGSYFDWIEPAIQNASDADRQLWAELNEVVKVLGREDDLDKVIIAALDGSFWGDKPDRAEYGENVFMSLRLLREYCDEAGLEGLFERIGQGWLLLTGDALKQVTDAGDARPCHTV